MDITIRASGSAPPATVWARYEHLDLWATWSPYLRSVEVDAEPGHQWTRRKLVPGLTGQVRGPLGLSVRFTVLTVDPGAMRWTWRVRRGPIALHLDHGVEAHDGGSLTTLTLSGPAPLVVGYLPPARWALRRLVSG